MNVRTIFTNKNVQIAAASSVAFAGGVVIGHILGKRRAQATIIVPAEPIEREPLRVHVTTEHVDSGNLTTETEYTLDEEGVATVVQTERLLHISEPEDAELINIFRKDVDPTWDYEAELQTRTDDAPYVIHKTEFIEDEMGYRQDTVTYYEGDDIMCDSQETVIFNPRSLMGEFAERWGHGSEDENVVYIRNEKMEMEWEILRHTGSYSIEVAGLEIEHNDRRGGNLAHAQPRVLKFRQE